MANEPRADAHRLRSGWTYTRYVNDTSLCPAHLLTYAIGCVTATLHHVWRNMCGVTRFLVTRLRAGSELTLHVTSVIENELARLRVRPR